uniref:Multidrug resistance-associated protein 4 n=1 Tax=Sipha flava TaxID=143950 RepID=A0A2S2QZL8_9HEMI
MDRLITDTENELERPSHPKSNANILEILTFSWLFKLFKTGQNRDLKENDLYKTLDDHSSSILGNTLEKTWKLEMDHAYKDNRNPSLLRALIKIFGAEYMLHGFIQLFQEIFLKTSRPLLIGGILTYLNSESSNKTDVTKAFICACGLFLIMIISTFVFHPNKLAYSHCGMKMRVACCSLMYRKALCISRSVFGETSVGNVVNLLSNDVNRFDVSIIYIHYLWIGPLQMIIVLYFLWQETGMSSLIGMSTFLIFIPLQNILGKNISKIRLKTANKTDERIRLMNEIISGIQLIKMYTWEKPFSKIIQYARKKEIQHIRAMLYVRAILSSIVLIHTKIQMFIIIVVYVLLENDVSIKNIFVIISFYSILDDTMRILFCLTLVNTRELLVSIKRIQGTYI